jgi:HD-like signal output (HDOD) protein/CheY-like chemotaxis protein
MPRIRVRDSAAKSAGWPAGVLEIVPSNAGSAVRGTGAQRIAFSIIYKEVKLSTASADTGSCSGKRTKGERMKHILFVDDQQHVLNSHREAMKKYRDRVQPVFAVGAEGALEIIRNEPIDVVVTDMHMPGVDGPMLLGAIKEDNPDIVRIMLCPLSEIDSVFVALPVSHQILSKPLDADALWNAIERIYALRELLTDSLRKKIGSLQQLPSVPTVYLEMMSAMSRFDVTPNKIARIIERDAAMSAKTLQLVNSACFGLTRRIGTIDQAVSYLGLDLVRDLSLTVHMFAALEPTAMRSGFSFDSEQDHSLLVAKIARRLAPSPRQARNAFTSGLLHDIGNLILAVCNTENYKKVKIACQSNIRPQHELEAEMIGVTHAEVGAYLLGLWGLPYPIVEAVAFHHNPSAALERSFDVPTAVSLANALVEEVNEDRPLPLPLEQHLAALKVNEQLPRWRAIAREEMQQMNPVAAK